MGKTVKLSPVQYGTLKQALASTALLLDPFLIAKADAQYLDSYNPATKTFTQSIPDVVCDGGAATPDSGAGMILDGGTVAIDCGGAQ